MADINLGVQVAPSYYDISFETNLKNRKIVLNEEISTGIVEKVIMNIINWNEEDDKAGLAIEDRQKITMYLNSNGGCSIIGFVLCDVMTNSKTPIETITLGMSYSMCSYIAMAGTKGMRKCYSFSNYLIHAGSIYLEGEANKVETTMKYYTGMKDSVMGFVLKHTDITKVMYNKKQREEWYINATLAKKLKIVDIIIGEE